MLAKLKELLDRHARVAFQHFEDIEVYSSIVDDRATLTVYVNNMFAFSTHWDHNAYVVDHGTGWYRTSLEDFEAKMNDRTTASDWSP